MKTFINFCTLVLVYFYFSSSSSVVLSVRVKMVCPAMCNCYKDEYSKLKKVECNGRKLINANIEAPVKTEYLDLSSNMITQLDMRSFEGLFQLTKIHLYSNTIATVYSDTFLRLGKLTFVDLSENRIEEIDEGLFQINHHLTTVILSYNKFAVLHNRPFLISDSLEILNLKKCQISHIYAETFRHLPKLKALDLSANSLATLNVLYMKPLKALNWLDLIGNPWKCDASIESIRQWVTKNDIMIFLMECAPKKNSMFEKIIVAPTVKQNPGLHEGDDDDSIEEWLIDNEVNNPKSRDYEDPKHVHEMLTECQERLVILAKDQKIFGTQRYYNSTKSIIFFFLGIIIGVLLSVSLFFIMVSRKTKRKWQQRELERDSRIVANEINEDGNIEIIANEVVDPSRRRRHPNRSCPQRPRKSFFASLFERRRAYRRFHPPTLIRRLSRSNLFSSTFGLNRSESRPRLDRQSSRRQNASQIQSARHDIEQRRFLSNEARDNQASGPASFIRPEHTVSTDTNGVLVIHRKSESPPPTYTDCMITFK